MRLKHQPTGCLGGVALGCVYAEWDYLTENCLVTGTFLRYQLLQHLGAILPTPLSLLSHLRGLFFIFDCHCWQLHISSRKESAIVIGLCWCRFLAAHPCPIWRYRGGVSWSLMRWKEDVPFHRRHWSHKRERRESLARLVLHPSNAYNRGRWRSMWDYLLSWPGSRYAKAKMGQPKSVQLANVKVTTLTQSSSCVQVVSMTRLSKLSQFNTSLLFWHRTSRQILNQNCEIYIPEWRGFRMQETLFGVTLRFQEADITGVARLGYWTVALFECQTRSVLWTKQISVDDNKYSVKHFGVPDISHGLGYIHWQKQKLAWRYLLYDW